MNNLRYPSSMKRTRFKLYMVTLALLAFTCQSLAAVQSTCQLAAHDYTDNAVENTMDSAHIKHLMSDKAETKRCCGQDDCSQMDCIFGGTALVSTLSSFSTQFSQTLDTEYSVSSLTQDASSPFRPPISR